MARKFVELGFFLRNQLIFGFERKNEIFWENKRKKNFSYEFLKIEFFAKKKKQRFLRKLFEINKQTESILITKYRDIKVYAKGHFDAEQLKCVFNHSLRVLTQPIGLSVVVRHRNKIFECYNVSDFRVAVECCSV